MKKDSSRKAGVRSGRPPATPLHVGSAFGRWTVLSIPDTVDTNGAHMAMCRCECGTTKLVSRGSLRAGGTLSCGCRACEVTAERNRTHGLSRTPEYKVWVGIKTRCCNTNHSSHERYGERGIEVCDRWAESFEAFLEDMGCRPSRRHSVERKDNNLGYSKENCVWATPGEQANNKNNNVIIELGGRRATLANWCREAGMPYHAVYIRIFRRGWEPSRALTTPVRKINKEKNKNVTDK